MEKKIYIFDLDGTLIDSMTMAWEKVMLKYLDDHGVVYPPDIISRVVALGFQGLVAYYKEHFHINEPAEKMLADILNGLQGLYDNVIPAKPNVEETLIALREKGIRLNVLTASPHRFLDPCLKRLGLIGYFDNLWTVEDLGVTKADPRIYEIIAQKLGVATSDCVMVDDSLPSLRTAKSAGVFTVGIYDEISKHHENIIREFVDQYIYNFKELL